MVVALLLIIAGLLFCFTGVGAIIGVPMIIMGFLVMLFKGTGRVGSRLLPSGQKSTMTVKESFVRILLVIVGIPVILIIASYVHR
ncbi:hypothetical protein EV217_2872 [Phyllobacterium myrsinacearum]|uniref:DUF5362 family protein n=1 Tax=Phyllobacterium myrsinacearum TaxID=28101 RepID=UPI001029D4D5|nr:DUF5362 family protein [Phyllobacterium myrsinacearum]RZS82059.1 hypothetical protein EV217_2872 [Phyllobacterium myrsinacearum]